MKPIYITTDTHYNHAKLVEVFKERPADFEKRISKGLESLPSNCTLIHLGDLSMGDRELGTEKWNVSTAHINNKIIVLGNHDKSASWFYDRGWSFVCNQFILDIFGHTVLFSHEPQNPDDFPITTLNIHGHTHGNTHREEDIGSIYDTLYHVELALENNDYKPFILNDKLVRIK